MLKTREYISRRLIDPEGRLTVSGNAALTAYEQIAKVSLLPALNICKKKEFIVIGSRIYNQLSDEIRVKTHLVMTARDLLRIRLPVNSITYDLRAYAAVCSLILNGNESAYEKLVARIKNTIVKTKAKILVANSTMDPINRIWIKVAKDLGINTACVQHGVYSNNAPNYFYEEDIVDHYVSLDLSQSKIIEKSIPINKIECLGVRKKFEWIGGHKPLKICFVGEDWERFGYLNKKRMIIHVYKEIAAYLLSRDCRNFYYKPHPSEMESFGINKSMRIIKNGELMIPDVYIGFSSTLLKEMASKEKLAIQIVDSEIISDVFEDNGYCISITRDSDMLENLYEKITTPQSVPMIDNLSLSDILKKY